MSSSAEAIALRKKEFYDEYGIEFTLGAEVRIWEWVFDFLVNFPWQKYVGESNENYIKKHIGVALHIFKNVIFISEIAFMIISYHRFLPLCTFVTTTTISDMCKTIHGIQYKWNVFTAKTRILYHGSATLWGSTACTACTAS